MGNKNSATSSVTELNFSKPKCKKTQITKQPKYFICSLLKRKYTLDRSRTFKLELHNMKP
jgi:hypothetical protein